MKTIINDYNLITNNDPLTMTIGNFDGLHQGHQQLIKTLKHFTDTKHAVMTFDPHPLTILRGIKLDVLMQIDDKTILLNEMGIDYLFIIKFTSAFQQISKDEFITFLKKINVKRLVLGRDTRFGYQGQGSIKDLKDHFEVVILQDKLIETTRVSTTYIKDLLLEGEIVLANQLLSRPYRIKGVVVAGNKVGRKLGFPTANIEYQPYFLPKTGVYHVVVIIDGKRYTAMANIGNNPTVNYQEIKRLEVNVFDFNQDIYDKTVHILFLNYIRHEKKFANKEALIEQLKADEIMIRKLSLV